MFGSGDGGGSERKTSVENKKKANSEAAKKFLEKEKSENEGTTRKKKIREGEVKFNLSANLSLRGCANHASFTQPLRDKYAHHY